MSVSRLQDVMSKDQLYFYMLAMNSWKNIYNSIKK